MEIEDIANRFVAAINQRDVEAIPSLMTEDHRFIESGRGVVCGHAKMKQGWIGYFKMAPDYAISVSETFASSSTVVLVGNASGTYASDGNLKTENRWRIPAAWRAVIKGEKISEWQIFADIEPIRRIMSRDKAI